MSTREAAKICMEKLNAVLICGRAIRIGWAQRNCRLHVTNLPSDISVDEIFTIFTSFEGLFESDSIEINHDGNFLINSQYEFIYNISYILLDISCSPNASVVLAFKKREVAEEAKQAINGMEFKGKQIYVDWYQTTSKKPVQNPGSAGPLLGRIKNSSNLPQDNEIGYESGIRGRGFSGRPGGISGTNPNNFLPVVSIYVRFETIEVYFSMSQKHIVYNNDNICISQPQKIVSEEFFYDLFQKFGRVTVVAIKNTVCDPVCHFKISHKNVCQRDNYLFSYSSLDVKAVTRLCTMRAMNKAEKLPVPQ